MAADRVVRWHDGCQLPEGERGESERRGVQCAQVAAAGALEVPGAGRAAASGMLCLARFASSISERSRRSSFTMSACGAGDQGDIGGSVAPALAAGDSGVDSGVDDTAVCARMSAVLSSASSRRIIALSLSARSRELSAALVALCSPALITVISCARSASCNLSLSFSAASRWLAVLSRSSSASKAAVRLSTWAGSLDGSTGDPGRAGATRWPLVRRMTLMPVSFSKRASALVAIHQSRLQPPLHTVTAKKDTLSGHHTRLFRWR